MITYLSSARAVLLCALLLLCCLPLTACAKDAPLDEPPALAEEEPAVSEPVLDESGLVWRVEPTLEYDKIYYCVEGRSFCTEDHDGYKIDTKTGQASELWADGHGGYLIYLLYDEKQNLYGYYANDEGYESFEMWSENDFLEKRTIYSNRLNAFQKIDSDKVKEAEGARDNERITTYDLSDAYISKKYAVAYGTTFVSEFIYDDNDSFSCAYVYYNVNGFIAMRLDNKWGILYKDGNTAAPFIFEDILLIDEGTAFAKINGKYGILELPEPVENSIAAESHAIYITTDNVNLREGPGTDSARITTIPQGTIVDVIDFGDGEWYLVEYDGQKGYMKAEFLAKAENGAADNNDSVYFIALEDQLLPPPAQVFGAEFEAVYKEFVAAVHNKDLQAIDRFLDDDIHFTFGEGHGKAAFYDSWGLNNDPKQSELWTEFEKIISLGGVYYEENKCFIAPYTFTDFTFDAYEYYVIIDKAVRVYAEESITSDVIDYLDFNIVKTDVRYGESRDLAREFWDKTDLELVKIKTPSGKYGYIQKQYIRSPIDYRFSIECNDNDEWKLGFMIAGD